MSLRYIDRFRPHLREQQQTAIDADQLRLSDEFEALDAQQLRPLAQLSFFLLLVGLLFFVSLNLISYFWWHYPPVHLSVGGILLSLLINLLGYILILPIHEGIHALAFLLWGGRPYFGAKLPLALFCGARDQLFPRNYYLVIGLAPLVVITLGAILFTCWRPDLAPYTLLASAGNLSGAAGDVWAVRRLLRQPVSVLVEDTDLGYRAWQIELSDQGH
jgi:Putative zincin peptidase